MSYPASSSGVEIARIPSGAVASMLENDATKNTIFFEDLTPTPLALYVAHGRQEFISPHGAEMSQTRQNFAKQE
jgi:hypothetical protein